MYTKRQRPPHVSDETQQEMCRTPAGIAPDLERGPPVPSERDRLADMIRRNLKDGLGEENLRRILEYLERH